MSITNPRLPITKEEAYGWGFTVGYMYEFPDGMYEAIQFATDDEGPLDAGYTPDIFGSRLDLAEAYRRGYDAGVAFYSDHSHGEA